MNTCKPSVPFDWTSLSLEPIDSTESGVEALMPVAVETKAIDLATSELSARLSKTTRPAAPFLKLVKPIDSAPIFRPAIEDEPLINLMDLPELRLQVAPAVTTGVPVIADAEVPVLPEQAPAQVASTPELTVEYAVPEWPANELALVAEAPTMTLVESFPSIDEFSGILDAICAEDMPADPVMEQIVLGGSGEFADLMDAICAQVEAEGILDAVAPHEMAAAPAVISKLSNENANLVFHGQHQTTEEAPATAQMAHRSVRWGAIGNVLGYGAIAVLTVAGLVACIVGTVTADKLVSWIGMSLLISGPTAILVQRRFSAQTVVTH